ncbi:MAG: glucokinase [Pyrinomonadaceae bacterium]
MILAGDIGGTNTRLALLEIEDKYPRVIVGRKFASREHKSLDEIVRQFLGENGPTIKRACIGVAGPIRNRQSTPSNLPWVVDADQLATLFGFESVTLVNDLEANAFGLAALEPKDFIVLNEGVPDPEGNTAIISAGTGLGEAGLHFEGKTRRPFASEGGHADFAPRNELEIELLRYLLRHFDHVSYERVLSGPGLLNIYRFLRDTGRGEEPAWLADEMQEADPSAVITQAALAGESELCMRALDLFVSIFGAEAGNLALKVKATGGVFLGGGIAPQIIEKLKGPTFIEAFTAKGRMRAFLEAVPVRVILNDMTALLGAAICASSGH